MSFFYECIYLHFAYEELEGGVMEIKMVIMYFEDVFAFLLAI